MRVVMKFGGTSVRDGQNIRHVAELVRRFHERGYEIVVVTSAMAGVTDDLLQTAESLVRDGKISIVREFIAKMTERHYDACKGAIDDDKIRERTFREIDERMDELEKVLLGITYLGELSSRSRDYIVSFGERLSAPILSGALCSAGVESLSITGGNAGIITDDNFGNARPLPASEERIKRRIEPLVAIKNVVPVICGFIGETESGAITTLGRGGSDYTATIVGSALNVDEIWLWKEVDGIMTADPKIVPEARVIPKISYKEAMELSYFGAKVLHPRALEPAMEKNIPVRVKNTFNPDGEGTKIVVETSNIDVVRAITLIERVGLISITGAGVDFATMLSETFRALAEHGVGIVMVSQGSSELNCSIVVSRDDLSRGAGALRSLENGISRVEVMDDIAVIAVVGSGMAGTPGVAGRVFSALGRNGINVIMISQGSSEYNISFAVARDDAENAVRVLHNEFGLGK